MSSLSDLFVSYLAISEPSITIPEYTVQSPSISFPTYEDIASKAETAKARTKAAAETTGPKTNSGTSFKWGSGGAKEASYTTSAENTTETKTQTEVSKPVYGGKDSWKVQMYEAYKRAGCSDQYARNLIGQDALETGWGRHTVGDYNYGNIKAGKSWTGRSKTAHDKREGSNDAYRSYESIDHYAQDKLRLLSTRYHMTGNETPEQFADKLVAGGYATAKTYRKQVLQTIRSV